MKKVFLKTLVGSLVISALLAIFIILTDFENEICGNILFTTLIIFPYSIGCLCCSSIYEKPKLKLLATIGIISNIIGILLFTGIIWDILEICIIFCDEDTSLTWNLLGTFILIPTSLSHISLLLCINTEDKNVKLVRTLTIIIGIIIDIIFMDSIWTQLIIDNKEKITFILMILMILGTIVTPILHLITKKQNKLNENKIVEEVTTLNKKKCPNCNNDINDNWKYCPYCNNSLITKEKEE